MGGQANKQNGQQGFGPGPGGPNSNPWASPGQGGGFAAGPPTGRLLGGRGAMDMGFGGGQGIRTADFRPEDQARMDMQNQAEQQKQAQIGALRGGFGGGPPQMPQTMPNAAPEWGNNDPYGYGKRTLDSLDQQMGFDSSQRNWGAQQAADNAMKEQAQGALRAAPQAQAAAQAPQFAPQSLRSPRGMSRPGGAAAAMQRRKR